MKLSILKIYKPAVFCVLLSLKSMLVSAQGPVQQFWALNQSSAVSGTFVWDNTGWNRQIDNGPGTFTLAAPVWTTNNGKTNTKWFTCNDVVFGGSPGIGAAGTVTLSAALSNVKSIAFHPAASGNFTLTGGSITSCSANLPVSVDSGLSPTLASVFSGTNSLTKTGNGTLSLTGTNTYTGATNVSSGTLQIGNGGTAGSIASGSAVNVSAGAIMEWNNSNASGFGTTISNPISGAGTLLLQGSNSNTKNVFSSYQLSGTNNLSNTIAINAARVTATTQSNFGAATIDIQQFGQLYINSGTAVITSDIIVEDKAGWWDNGFNLGAIRMEGGTSMTFSGNITLNNTTNITLGDGSGQYSTMGTITSGGVCTISGVISGPGNFALSRQIQKSINIKITGTSSNTYTGITTVDGQGYVSTLNLMKTSGAVAIAPNNLIWMGSNTAGQANLRMGDDQNTGSTTGAARNQWDNQFGAGVEMQFKNASGQWMRFDLQGTNQTLSGLNAGTTTTPAGAVIQNQNIQNFNPNNPASLTLNGAGNYVYNGYFRDHDNSQTANKLNLIWNGSGTHTFVGQYIYHTGTTNVNSGRLVCYNTNKYCSNTTINAGGTYEMNVPSGTLTVPASYTINGTGLLIKSGSGNWAIGTSGKSVSIAMNTGGMFDIQAGAVQNNNVTNEWANNKGSVNLASGATLDLYSDPIYLDALTGVGTITNGYATNGVQTLYVGVSNTTNNAAYGVSANTATFSGVINNANGNVAVVKQGTGTQIFAGNNTYSGGTTINGGTLKADSLTAFGTGTITVNAGATLNKNSFAITNTIINNGGTVLN